MYCTSTVPFSVPHFVEQVIRVCRRWGHPSNGRSEGVFKMTEVDFWESYRSGDGLLEEKISLHLKIHNCRSNGCSEFRTFLSCKERSRRMPSVPSKLTVPPHRPAVRWVSRLCYYVVNILILIAGDILRKCEAQQTILTPVIDASPAGLPYLLTIIIFALIFGIPILLWFYRTYIVHAMKYVALKFALYSTTAYDKVSTKMNDASRRLSERVRG